MTLAEKIKKSNEAMKEAQARFIEQNKHLIKKNKNYKVKCVELTFCIEKKAWVEGEIFEVSYSEHTSPPKIGEVGWIIDMPEKAKTIFDGEPKRYRVVAIGKVED